MSGRTRIDVNKIDKRAKCEICRNNFVGCEDPNLPVKNPCGCMFHEYCLYKYGGGSSYCPGSSCHRSGPSGSGSSGVCNNCKDLNRQIKQLTSENTKLNKKVEQLSGKSSDSTDLRKENKKLTSEISKLQKKIVQISKISIK